MKRLIGSAAWLAVLTLAFIVCSSLAPPKQAAAQEQQYRFVSPKARPANGVKIQKLMREYNELAAKVNEEVDSVPAWYRKPEESADTVAQMALKLNEIYSLLIHIDEEPR